MNIEKKLRQFQKNLKQGKYKTVMMTGSMCVAAACMVLLGMYFIQGKNAEKDIERLREMKSGAQVEEAVNTDQIEVSDKQVMNDYKELFLENPDIIGWLTIEGTSIDYPVMWTPEDPEYYSHRGFDKEDSINGLLFLDSSSNVNEKEGNLIIYGHNMKNGSMFADLFRYEKKSYGKTHHAIQFDTLYEKRIYEITAVAKTDDMELLPFGFTNASRSDGQTAIQNMKDHSLYDTGVDMEYGEDYLTLATCDYSKDNGRLVVMARRIQ